MKILMLGWEFPPKISGGLGVASQGLAEALVDLGHQVKFLLPKKSPKQVSRKVQLMNASALKPDVAFWKKTSEYMEIIRDTELGTLLLPYLPAQTFIKAQAHAKVVFREESTPESDLLESIKLTGDYNSNLGAELMKYAMLAVQVAKREKPDVIHAHDWITFRAGIFIQNLLKIPLFVHVHSTEYDRNGVHAQEHVIDEEKKGLVAAAHIFCVSEKLRHTISTQYNVAPEKISVVPNAVNLTHTPQIKENPHPKNVAFIGRLTHQKSPTTFIDLARDLTSKGHDFHYFIMGDGYLRPDLENRLRHSNFSERVTFTGFLEHAELLNMLYQMDLLVVPSTSEPFGLVALEAILNGIPVAAARGIGAAEFIPDLPQVDRWDHFSYVKLIERLMSDGTFRKTVAEKCLQQALTLSWEKTARLVSMKYENIGR